MDEFERKNREMICRMGKDERLLEKSSSWFLESTKFEYSYHFTWMGLPIIQYPQDVMAIQELIWTIKPDLIIETGIARGGSLIFSASMLELLGGNGRVLGIDIDIRSHNRAAIEAHPMAKRIQMLEGSSIDLSLVKRVAEVVRGRDRVLVLLDSMHTHDHVLRELELYSPFVKKGSYCVVLDTVIEDLPTGSGPDRPWGKGNSPKSAVWKFLATNKRFEVDKGIDNKLLLSVAPDGYLKCIAD